MILVGETLPYAREVAFNLPRDENPLEGLEGHAFALGQVRIRPPGQPWQDVLPTNIVEKGYGRYAVRLTFGQVLAAGRLYLRVSVSGAQPYVGYETIGTTLAGDLVQGVGGPLPFFLADENDPIYGTPLSGPFADLPGAAVRACFPNGTYQDLDPAVVEEIGHGSYALNVTDVQAALRGKVYVYACADGAQPFEGWFEIVAGTTAPSPPVEPDPPTPVPVPIVYGDPEYTNQLALALNRLPHQFRSGTLAYNLPAASIEVVEVIGTFVPPPSPIEYTIHVPVAPDPGTSAHLAAALNRLPQQFRSGTLAYNLPAATKPREIVGSPAPRSAVEYDIQLPVIADEATTGHLEVALKRLPHQFRSGLKFYGGATLDNILDGGV